MSDVLVPSNRQARDELELAADEILFYGVEWLSLSYREKRDTGILTKYQFDLRYRREVFVKAGVPEALLFHGIYSRRANLWHPWLNSHSCFNPMRPREIGQRPTMREIYENWGSTDFGKIEPVWMYGVGFDDFDGATAFDSTMSYLTMQRRRQWIERMYSNDQYGRAGFIPREHREMTT